MLSKTEEYSLPDFSNPKFHNTVTLPRQVNRRGRSLSQSTECDETGSGNTLALEEESGTQSLEAKHHDIIMEPTYYTSTLSYEDQKDI